MDILENYVTDNLLSKENILKYVDDYSIYSFYIGAELELNTKYSSPLRLGDEDPSFSLYYSKYKTDKIFFKDQSTGKNGDVFTFLYELMSLSGLVSNKTVLLQINSDFGLGLCDEEVGEFKPQLLKTPPLRKDPVKIAVNYHKFPTKAFTDYWSGLDISQRTLDKYYARDVRVIHFINGEHKTITPKTLTISYEILGHYKIYQPFADKKDKFRNDYLDIYVEGALQLEFKHEFAIITKSTKECMFFDEHFGWDTVAGKSENTMIPPHFMENVLRKRYKKVLIWLDNDEAGINAQNKYLAEYPWLIPVTFDSFIEQKDVTDLYSYAKSINKTQESLIYIKTKTENAING